MQGGVGAARHREPVIDDAADGDAEEPAIDAPPRGQPMGEVRQDRGEQRPDHGGDDRPGVPAAGIGEFAVLVVERRDVHHAFADQVIVDHDDAEQRPHRRADHADETRRAALPTARRDRAPAR